MKRESLTHSLLLWKVIFAIVGLLDFCGKQQNLIKNIIDKDIYTAQVILAQIEAFILKFGGEIV